METSAIDWRDASPLGNGRLGALHYGGLAHDRILLNHEALFANAETPEMPDISPDLPKLRQMLREGKWLEANDFFGRRWAEMGYNPQPAKYLPGPVFNWDNGSLGNFQNYTRTIDFQSGVETVRWESADGPALRRLFVSMTDDCALFEPCGGHVTARAAELWFEPQDPSESTDDSGIQIPIEIHTRTLFGDDWMATIFEGPGEARYAAIAVWKHGNATRLPDERGVRLEWDHAPTIALNLLLDPAENELRAEAGRMRHILRDTRAGERHATSHREWYNRCRLDLVLPDAELSNEVLFLRAQRGQVPPALLARMANFGRYLLIGSTGIGTLPPNLQGIWNGNYEAPWWGGFFFNENVQLALSPALTGGLPECVLQLFDLLESKLADFRINARRLFGCRGILPPLFMTPDSGLKKNPQAHVMYWTGSGAWLSQLYFDYWQNTGDVDFLRQRALPFLREAAAFYEDFFEEGDDGYLHCSPSNSPENYPSGQVDESGRGLRVCVDATMDFTLARELFTNLIKLAESAGGEAPETLQQWTDFLQKLPPYRINEDGALAEWIDPRFSDNYHHRHLSHLYGLFPGREITPAQKELFQACRTAVEKRLVIGLGSQTGWSLAHMAQVFCRLGDADRAVEALEILCRFVTGNNLFTAHNDLHDMGVTMQMRKGLKPAVQTEANQGLTAALYEMIVLSNNSNVTLFPALPEGWRKGSLTGLCLHGGGRINIEWDRDADTWSANLWGASKYFFTPTDYFKGESGKAFQAICTDDNPATLSGKFSSFEINQHEHRAAHLPSHV